MGRWLCLLQGYSLQTSHRSVATLQNTSPHCWQIPRVKLKKLPCPQSVHSGKPDALLIRQSSHESPRLSCEHAAGSKHNSSSVPTTAYVGHIPNSYRQPTVWLGSWLVSHTPACGLENARVVEVAAVAPISKAKGQGRVGACGVLRGAIARGRAVYTVIAEMRS